ncbi:hypothetical protein E1B28_004956 [Marasmius oreades]|uniref:TEA domain-containing protein n=1 Tax=Marasmius oreades TaxID=181124 RepID=A0A9P7UZR9_9AGAR|nr:uncharacterized protein E1B28_004956 [Marasmius oreades]KAG7097623.1 hypothetical protein E1B28_004956 [Marasmius oreades]
MDGSTWCSQSTSSGSSSPSPRLVNSLRVYGDNAIDGDHLGTKEVFNEVVRGRKSWKTLKGGEMVWSPDLEAALLEGLASYQPDDSRETRLLGRFPMRNRYISAYIYQKTGKERSAKQVGSRLQQLRDTCGGKKLQHLLSPCRKHKDSATSKGFNYNSLHRYGFSKLASLRRDPSERPASPIVDSREWLRKSTVSPMYIYILPGNGCSAPERPIYDPPSVSSSLGAVNHPRPIRTIDPTLTFVSYSPLDRSTRSSFNVYDSHGFIHTEESSLVLSMNDERGYYYTTCLIPGFWETICKHTDPTEFTIEHKVIQDDISHVQSDLFSAVYKFRYPAESDARLSSRPSGSTEYVMSQDSHHGSPSDDFHSPSTASDDLFDLSDIGLPRITSDTTSYDMTCLQGYGRSVSLPSSPKPEVGKELYHSRRGSDPSLAWSYSDNAS